MITFAHLTAEVPFPSSNITIQVDTSRQSRESESEKDRASDVKAGSTRSESIMEDLRRKERLTQIQDEVARIRLGVLGQWGRERERERERESERDDREARLKEERINPSNPQTEMAPKERERERG